MRALIILFFFLPFFGTDSLQENHTVISRSYCTEIGKFDMMFDDDEISGSYSLSPKKSLGAIWGKLDKKVMTGRWLDADGQGEIIITFNDDFSWFTTDYRNDEHPDTWYRDSWHGALRDGDKSEFVRAGKTYRCE